MAGNINEWFASARAKGTSDEEIRKQLLSSGWPQEEIDAILRKPGDPVPPQLRGIDRLKSDKKAQTFQRAIIWWLIANLLLRIGLLIIISIEVTRINESALFLTGMWIMIGIVFIPAIVVLIGIIKVKAWAYWLYLIVLFFSLVPSGIPESATSLIIMIISVLGSAAAFFITIFLYSRLFPSKRAQRVVGS